MDVCYSLKGTHIRMTKDVNVDFVIASNGAGVGFCSTNMKCPIFGYKKDSNIQEAISVIKEDFPAHTYTYYGIKDVEGNAREFQHTDKIHHNKTMYRLHKVCPNFTRGVKDNVR